MKVLLLPIEFTSWFRARAWSYTGAYAFVDGFRKNNIDFFISPIFIDENNKSNFHVFNSFFDDFEAMEFDQVWVWCVHSDIPEYVWSKLKDISPIIVGVVMESISFLKEELEMEEFPNLNDRQEKVLKQLENCTHSLMCSKDDSDLVQKKLGISSHWYPPMFPEEYVRFEGSPNVKKMAFIGSCYGKRSEYLKTELLDDILYRPHLPERDSGYPESFDLLCASIQSENRPEALKVLLKDLIDIRKKLFELHLEGLRMGCASVNLPSIVKGYAGRVIESMGASVPVVSILPLGDEQRSLFLEDLILFFNSPDELRSAFNSLEYVSKHMVVNARNQLLVRHTSRIRVAQFQKWILNDCPISYDEDICYRPSYEDTEYYNNFFVSDSSWNRETPNSDEQSRWEVIKGYIEKNSESNDRKILDVGCGRGWLSNLLKDYGDVTAIEPVGDVINYARSIFSDIDFIVGSSELLEFQGGCSFNLVVSSEVIEHIPYRFKQNFVKSLVNLTDSGGSIIISTPRKDILDQWQEKYGTPAQPTEDWLFENDLKYLFESEGCKVMDLKYSFIMDIYQIWHFVKK